MDDLQFDLDEIERIASNLQRDEIQIALELMELAFQQKAPPWLQGKGPRFAAAVRHILERRYGRLA